MNGKTTADTVLGELHRLIREIDMADADRTRIEELISDVAYLKFCKGYDAAAKFYQECIINNRETSNAD
jgi:hypothetical protein